jgi:hypothetical protein
LRWPKAKVGAVGTRKAEGILMQNGIRFILRQSGGETAETNVNAEADGDAKVNERTG